MPKPSSRNIAVQSDAGAIRDRIFRVIREGPCSTQVIARKTGYGQGTVRTILQEAIARRLIAASGRPVLYTLVEDAPGLPVGTLECMDNGYRGTPLPYFRPGSYVPPSQPRVPMFAVEVAESDLLAVDAMVRRQEELGR